MRGITLLVSTAILLVPAMPVQAAKPSGAQQHPCDGAPDLTCDSGDDVHDGSQPSRSCLAQSYRDGRL